MKTEETIEKDQNRQMPGVNEKKKKLKPAFCCSLPW